MDQQHPSTPNGRGVRSHSFRSDRSGGSKGRNDIIESPKDKEMRERLWSSKSKANPNAAITEAQPGDIARLEEATIAPLRGHTYKDANGNPILDPDLSNPTRSRFERPLDTIRLHEQRIEEGYKRRSTYGKTETTYAENQQYASKRNSYFGIDGNNGGGSRPLQAGNGTHAPPQSTSTRRHHTPRMQSDPNASYPTRPYGHHTYHQSQNTMNTDLTNGSDSTGPWASHTDPSSENSSIDKPNGGHRSQQYDSHNNNYGGYSQNSQGYSGYANGTGVRASIPEERASGNYYAGPPPPASPEVQRRPIPLNKSSGGPMSPPRADLPVPPRPETAKRGSWIKRTFSKRG